MSKTITRAAVRSLRERLQNHLATLAEQLRMNIEVGTATYSPSNVTFKVTLAVVGQDGSAVTPEAEDFRRHATSYGLKHEDLHRSFRYAGKDYKIVGVKPRATRFPIIAEDADGKRYKLPAETVCACLSPAVLADPGKPRRPDAAILADIRGVDCNLSPENLSADGQLPISEINRRRRQLEVQRQSLVAELGREPTEEELYKR